MPATPAWPPDSAPRLFVDEALEPGRRLRLEGAPAHYLGDVMRLRPGATVKLFDDRSGEYAAELTALSRRTVELAVGQRLRAREPVPDLWLCAVPIRRQRFDWVAEKAAELGVRRFVPVLTRRAVVDRVRPDRLRAHMIEAAEQCERTALPELAELVPLDQLLRDWPAGRTLFFADERGGAAMAGAVRGRPGPAAILIGPEGGFEPAEAEAIRALPAAEAISLGPRILRADTAAVAAVSLWMGTAGDWV